MVLIYEHAKTREHFLGPDGVELLAELHRLVEELEASGELLYNNALADPSQTRTVRVRDGAPVVTDGPLAEAKEHFGGYLLLDCESMDRAVEIATRFPGGEFTPLEVRPIMEFEM